MIGDFFQNGGGSPSRRLTASAAQFPVNIAQNALIASLSRPFGAGSAFSVVGAIPSQLALVNGQIVKGAGAAVGDASYDVKIRAQNAGNTQAIEQTFRFTAKASAAAVTSSAIFSLPANSQYAALLFRSL